MTKAGDIIATVDIGSNATRYRLFAYTEAAECQNCLAPAEMERIRYPVQLGNGTFSGGHLAAADIDNAVDALREIAERAEAAGAREIIAVATSAVREAANQQEFVERAWAEADVRVQVISAEEEARLAALGASSGGSNPGDAYVIDIGGGSTEVVALGSGGQMRWNVSLPVGAVRLSRRWNLAGAPSQAELENYQHEIASIISKGISEQTDRLGGIRTGRSSEKPAPQCWALGGTPGALEQILRNRTNLWTKEKSYRTFRSYKSYRPDKDTNTPKNPISRDPRLPQSTAQPSGDTPGRTIARATFDELFAITAQESADALTQDYGLDAHRAPLLLPGAIILRGLLDHLCLGAFTPSDAGVCEGLAWAALARAQ